MPMAERRPRPSLLARSIRSGPGRPGSLPHAKSRGDRQTELRAGAEADVLRRARFDAQGKRLGNLASLHCFRGQGACALSDMA